jgi:hypothetical protein
MPLSSATVFTLLALLAWPVSATWTQVPGGVSWNLQYTGTLANMTTKVIDIDLFDTSNTTIQKWRKQGHTVICYFSAGSSESKYQTHCTACHAAASACAAAAMCHCISSAVRNHNR